MSKMKQNKQEMQKKPSRYFFSKANRPIIILCEKKFQDKISKQLENNKKPRRFHVQA